MWCNKDFQTVCCFLFLFRGGSDRLSQQPVPHAAAHFWVFLCLVPTSLEVESSEAADHENQADCHDQSLDDVGVGCRHGKS